MDARAMGSVDLSAHPRMQLGMHVPPSSRAVPTYALHLVQHALSLSHTLPTQPQVRRKRFQVWKCFAN
eukprot:3162098-Amphidinium_carterae.1